MEDKKIIAAFRRTPFAAQLERIVRASLANARDANEGPEGSTTTHENVQEHRQVMLLLFGENA